MLALVAHNLRNIDILCMYFVTINKGPVVAIAYGPYLTYMSINGKLFSALMVQFKKKAKIRIRRWEFHSLQLLSKIMTKKIYKDSYICCIFLVSENKTDLKMMPTNRNEMFGI